MVYRSNLPCPDIQKNFKHLQQRVMPSSMGHDVLSDFADYPDDHPVFGLYKQCGFWTHDEAAILFECAKRCPGEWLDIGAHTGWTASVIAAASCPVEAIDPIFLEYIAFCRFIDNVKCFRGWIRPWPRKSDDWFHAMHPIELSGVCIDGDHERPQPLLDARHAIHPCFNAQVILFHDFWGPPVQEAVLWLMDHGFQAKIYNTPYGVACCWRGNFTPPDHVPDPAIDWVKQRAIFKEFPYERTV